MYITRFQLKTILIGFFILTSWLYMSWEGQALAAREACEDVLKSERKDAADMQFYCFDIKHDGNMCAYEDKRVCDDIYQMYVMECKSTDLLRTHYTKARCGKEGRKTVPQKWLTKVD